MPDANVYHAVVAHDAPMRIILVFWSFGRGYEPLLTRPGALRPQRPGMGGRCILPDRMLVIRGILAGDIAGQSFPGG